MFLSAELAVPGLALVVGLVAMTACLSMSAPTTRGLSTRNEYNLKHKTHGVYAVADAIRVQVELRSRSYCTCAEALW
jgi:hypothetical protein